MHIVELIKALRVRGDLVYTYSDSTPDGAERLSENRFTRHIQLAGMDAFYMRVDGVPQELPAFMRFPLRTFFRHVPIVWELEATPEIEIRGRPDRVATSEASFARFREMARHASLAICMTPGLERYGRDLGISQRVIVPNASDPDVFRPDAPGGDEIPPNADGLNVVWHGGPEAWWHDIGSIIGAAKMLEDDSRVRFYFLSTRDIGTDLPSNVQVLKGRDHAGIPGLLARMDVGLCIYRNETWSSYGSLTSPLKLFDYLATGLVVVASPIDQVKETFSRRDAGFTVPFEDPQALAERLRTIAVTKRAMSDKRAAGPKLVREFYNWDRVAAQTAESILALKGRA